jgi:lysine 2,3-aminomutase
VRDHQEIRDVIVSGGDPLSLPVARLRWFINELDDIDHLDVIRLGTRVPVTLPQRLFDTELIDMLKAAGKIWIQTHFNHPREITPATARACRNLVNAGMPVSNHAVLLKGVNDSVPVMRELMRGLLRIKVRPYYLFHCDPVTGAGHFRTSIWKGLEIIEGLRGHISGLGVPTYVVDGLHGAGKIPLMPNYLVSAADNAVILRNYEGMLFRYAPEDRESGPQSQYPSLGVSGLLGGQQSKLMPEGNARMARREQNAAESPMVAANGNGHGGANGNGHAYGGGSVRANGDAGRANGDAGRANGNGHANGDAHADETKFVEPLLPVLGRL